MVKSKPNHLKMCVVQQVEQIKQNPKVKDFILKFPIYFFVGFKHQHLSVTITRTLAVQNSNKCLSSVLLLQPLILGMRGLCFSHNNLLPPPNPYNTHRHSHGMAVIRIQLVDVAES